METVSSINQSNNSELLINVLSNDVVDQPGDKKTKVQRKLEDWTNARVGQTVNGGRQMAAEAGVSYPSANNFINANPTVFTKIKKGEFTINTSFAN